MKRVENEFISSSLDEYIKIRPDYEDFSEETKRIIVESFRHKSISYHNIDARAKTLDSFEFKSKRVGIDGVSKYKSPIKDITDLSGVRIITYTLRDVELVCDFISVNFEVVEKKDIGEERFKEGKFGYQSIHFLVKFHEARVALPENMKYFDKICEIQVRTVLQHAWAEIEHDIQYKNQSGLPRVLQRKFIALAGLLEVADREFQAIQDEDHSLKKSIKESLQEDLTRDAVAEKGASLSRNSELKIYGSEEFTVRGLIKAGRYGDAINIYNDKISISTNSHTLYLGRAKARFLDGDRDGALKDIEMSLELKPDDDAGKKLREQVLEGGVEKVKTTSLEGGDLTRKANAYLESGDGVGAFEYYSLAQEQGASRPFSIINKSMSCFLVSDFDGAKYLLSSFELRPGTIMAISIHSLYCLIYAATESEKYEEEFDKLSKAYDEADNFVFLMSPLAKLRAGIQKSKMKTGKSEKKKIDAVFSKIDVQAAGRSHDG